MKIEAASALIQAAHYPALCRHFQFSDLHNGFWYVEVLEGSKNIHGLVTGFYVQEVRNGVVVRRSAEPLRFPEARRIFWARSYSMSVEAGIESLPPPAVKIDWR